MLRRGLLQEVRICTRYRKFLVEVQVGNLFGCRIVRLEHNVGHKRMRWVHAVVRAIADSAVNAVALVAKDAPQRVKRWADDSGAESVGGRYLQRLEVGIEVGECAYVCHDAIALSPKSKFLSRIKNVWKQDETKQSGEVANVPVKRKLIDVRRTFAVTRRSYSVEDPQRSSGRRRHPLAGVGQDQVAEQVNGVIPEFCHVRQTGLATEV